MGVWRPWANLAAHGIIECAFRHPQRTAREPVDHPVCEQLKALLYQTVMSLPRGENGTICLLHNAELRQLARVVQALVK